MLKLRLVVSRKERYAGDEVLRSNGSSLAYAGEYCDFIDVSRDL